MALFFGKMQDASEVESLICTANNNGLYYGEMQTGDYVFIRLKNEVTPDGVNVSHVHRLWKCESINVEENGKSTATFSSVFDFQPITTSDFPRLDFIKPSNESIVLTSRQIKGRGFIKIEITNQQVFQRIIANETLFNEYISDPSHYRKIVYCNSLDEVNPNSIDLQLYKVDDDYVVYSTANHFASEIASSINNDRAKQITALIESGKLANNKLASQRKVYKWLTSENHNENISFLNFWDFFCSRQSPFSLDTDDDEEGEASSINYYLISASPSVFSFSALPINGKVDFSYRNEKGRPRQINRNFKNIKQGDLIVCYDSTPSKAFVSLGELTENIDGDKIWIKKIADFANPIPYQTVFELPIMSESEWVKIPRGTLYKLTKEQFDAIINLSGGEVQNNSTSPFAKTGYNKIFYGLPGCGKSYRIENEVLRDASGKSLPHIRTTFYQDYSYSDFVGQILPVILEDGKTLSYKFKSGPFFDALQQAYENPSETIYLVIEELNRGNAPSIFGDLFQLLDRVHEPGENYLESEYPINNNLIASNMPSLPEKHNGKVFIPSNLVILATMNTSDQNVFTLDTAFKRRWEFEEIKNDFNNHPYAKMFVPNTSVTWEDFVTSINDAIINLQTTLSSSEDKRLGAYFVSMDELSKEISADDTIVNKFAYKVLEYLWDDVVRFNRDQLFKPEYKTLTDLISGFKKKQLDIFIESIKFSNEQ